MFFYLSQSILDMAAGTTAEPFVSPLRLFRYITFRSAGAAVTALLLSWWMYPRFILWLKQLRFGQDYVDRAEEAGGLQARILSKKGTPTMGGLLIVLVLDVTAMMWAQWNTQVLLALTQWAVGHGVELPGLTVVRPSLEDVYLRITGQAGVGAGDGH